MTWRLRGDERRGWRGFHRTATLSVLAALTLGGCAARPPGRPFEPPPATAPTDWHGYERYAFTLSGRHCIVVRPAHAAPGTPWVWRATFFGQRPEVELGLLARGFHVAYMDVTDLCGSPGAVALWDEFYRYLTTGGYTGPGAGQGAGA